MILQPDDKLFEELYYLLFTSRGDKEVHNFSCTIMTPILAYHLAKHIKKVWIIDTSRHCVLYDGKSTWDFNLGIVFENYMYPKLSPPKYYKIQKFFNFFDQKNYDFYYSDLSELTITCKKVLINENQN